jgi:lysosomal acid lipase/cholesteryl ester hydrolase
VTLRRSLAGLATGVGVASAGLLSLGAWYRRFEWDGEPDERLSADTADGWQLTLARYRPPGPSQKYPLVLSHGFAGSGLIYDLGRRWSLARFLAEAGFEVFCVDLRGRRRSWPGGESNRSLQWSFDDFVFSDLPAAMDAACEASGAESAFWLGMEMSGQVVYAAAISGTATRVRGAVTFGSPALTPASAKVPGVTSAPRGRRHGRVPFRTGARPAGPVLAYGRSKQLESSFRMAHTDPLPVARYFRNGIPDESVVLADQFTDWVKNGVMRSLDGATVWSDRLGEVRLPLLLLAAASDLQRPPASVEATATEVGGDDVTFVRVGTKEGFGVDYGHDDLLVCDEARKDVFPLVRDWLLERST